jgi:hypothetical protein
LVITPVINGISRVYQSNYNWGYKPLTKWDEPPSMDLMGFKRISWDLMDIQWGVND